MNWKFVNNNNIVIHTKDNDTNKNWTKSLGQPHDKITNEYTRDKDLRESTRKVSNFVSNLFITTAMCYNKILRNNFPNGEVMNDGWRNSRRMTKKE